MYVSYECVCAYSETYMYTSLGATFMTFAMGALAFWSPVYIYKSVLTVHGQADDAR